MANSAADTHENPVQIKLADGSLFVCRCNSKEFKITKEDVPMYYICRCGMIYTVKDLPPLEGSDAS